MSQKFPVRLGTWSIDHLETGLTPVPPKSLNSPGSSPTMELQGTETNINGIADLGPSVATLWNDAWIDPSILAWDEPVQGQTKPPMEKHQS